jgi:putative tricarboxylic transport membrane protein
LPYVVVFAGAAALYAIAGRFEFVTKPGSLGPDVWPKAILAVAMLVCLLEIAWRLFEPASSLLKKEAPGEEAEQEAPRLPQLLAAGIGLSLLYVGTLELLGFFLATAAYLALFMAVGRYRRWPVVAATSLLGSLAFVFVFMKVVYVSLPLGRGPFQQVSLWVFTLLGIH